MDSLLARLTDRYANSQDTCVGAAMRAIRAGAVSLRSHSDGLSSRELARTYARRAEIAQSQGRHAAAETFRTIAVRCEANGEHSCSLWVLTGGAESFALFELVPSHTIVGCLRFEGPLDEGEL